MTPAADVPDVLGLAQSLAPRLHVVEPSDRLLVEGATVIDGTGGEPVTGQAVLVEGGTIVRLAPAGEIGATDRDGAHVVDAAGLTLLPGLIDLHVHFTGHPPRDEHQRYLEANEHVRSIRATRDAMALLNAGFTTVRSLGHGTPETATALKTALAEGVMRGPTVKHSGWALSQSGGHGTVPYWPLDLIEERLPRSAFCDGVDGCRLAVRRNFGAGADCTKVYATQGKINSPDSSMHLPNFTIEELTAICDETHRLRSHVAAHATGAEGARNAVLAGVDSIEHGPCDADAAAEELLKLMAERRTVLVPTMLVFASAAEGRFTGPIQERARRWYCAKQDIVRQAHAMGVPIAVGTDSSVPPLTGQNARELELLVEAGLTPIEAIASATSVAAGVMRLGRRLGTIAAGFMADMLLVRGDPSTSIGVLEDAGRIERIFKSRQTWSSDFVG
jgi:imidazolonepropionase-like amidohydrolase